jgi:hypothetical protein
MQQTGHKNADVARRYVHAGTLSKTQHRGQSNCLASACSVHFPSYQIEPHMQMADKIVLRSVESLIPYARNARTHSDAQVARVEAGRAAGAAYVAIGRLLGGDGMGPGFCRRAQRRVR